MKGGMVPDPVAGPVLDKDPGGIPVVGYGCSAPGIVPADIKFDLAIMIQGALVTDRDIGYRNAVGRYNGGRQQPKNNYFCSHRNRFIKFEKMYVNLAKVGVKLKKIFLYVDY